MAKERIQPIRTSHPRPGPPPQPLHPPQLARGNTSIAIRSQASSLATSNSKSCCKPSHNSAEHPKYRANRSAIIALTPRFSFTIPETWLGGTRNARASALIDNPIGVKNSSRRISPGCTGAIIVFFAKLPYPPTILSAADTL